VLKLEACKRALSAGVQQVCVVGGTIPDGLLAAVNGAEFGGTRVMFTHPAAAGAAAQK
jgi:acetylglutamate kinase